MAATETIIPGQGWVFTGNIDATAPDISAIDISDDATFGGMKLIGHTSKENPPSLAKEGGEVTNFDSWDTPALRSVVSTTNWSLTVNALSITKETLEMAFPGGQWDTVTKSYKIPAKQATVSKSILVLMKDNESGVAAFYFPRGAIAIGDAPSIATDGFFEIQLAISALTSTDGTYVMQVFVPRVA